MVKFDIMTSLEQYCRPAGGVGGGRGGGKRGGILPIMDYTERLR